MNAKQAKDLIEKYSKGEASADEKVLLDNWFFQHSQKQVLNEDEENFLHLKGKIWKGVLVQSGLPDQKVIKPIAHLLRQRIAIAATLALIVLGVYFFIAPLHLRFSASQHYANDISPGKNKATLTLADGKVISLSAARTGVIVDEVSLKYNDGTEIASSLNTSGNRIEMLTAATPRGGTYSITLPDGTRVWLNAASLLKFPASFANVSQRRVELVGEAYFEVAKDKKHAFIVQTAKQQVEVLGTHFNINGYPDEGEIKTTLLEGSVRISAVAAIFQQAGGNIRQVQDNVVVLKPSQQSIYAAGKINVIEVDPDQIVAWKEGSFMFNNEKLGSVMRKLARWYDVEVIYEDQSVENGLFYGTVSRDANISKILDKLKLATNLAFKIEGRKVTVLKDNSKE